MKCLKMYSFESLIVNSLYNGIRREQLSNINYDELQSLQQIYTLYFDAIEKNCFYFVLVIFTFVQSYKDRYDMIALALLITLLVLFTCFILYTDIMVEDKISYDFYKNQLLTVYDGSTVLQTIFMGFISHAHSFFLLIFFILLMENYRKIINYRCSRSRWSESNINIRYLNSTVNSYKKRR